MYFGLRGQHAASPTPRDALKGRIVSECLCTSLDFLYTFELPSQTSSRILASRHQQLQYSIKGLRVTKPFSAIKKWNALNISSEYKIQFSLCVIHRLIIKTCAYDAENTFSVVKNMFRSTRPLRIEFLHLLFFLNKYDIWSTAPAPNLLNQELGIWVVPLGKLTFISFIEPAP